MPTPFGRRILIAPFQRPLWEKVDPIRDIIDKGLILDSPDIGARRLPNGQTQLYLKKTFSAATPTGVIPTPGPGSVGSFTEFYAQNGGSNLNAGSTTDDTAVYTSTNGNWTSNTCVFIPSDGSTPANTVSVGMFASVYIDGATVGVFISRVTNVAAGVNGAITLSTTVIAGIAPATSATTRTIKVGGAWKGPNAAIGYPLNIGGGGLGKLVNVAGDQVRFNLKDDQVYNISAGINCSNPANAMFIQGYHLTPGDGIQSTINCGTNAITLLQPSPTIPTYWYDIEFKNQATTGANDLVVISGNCAMTRCTFHGARGAAFSNSGLSTFVECEAYACNLSNLAAGTFVTSGQGASFIRCYSHDHTGGTNGHGFRITGGGATLVNCIADTCSGNGLSVGTINAPVIVKNCDFYNNTGDGIQAAAGAILFHIENCNFIKNHGKGINNTAQFATGFAWNCGYGSGSEVNGSPDTTGHIIKQGDIIYDSGASPYSDQSTGNFTIILGDATGTGRGAFLQTDNSNTGTQGTPNIGAA